MMPYFSENEAKKLQNGNVQLAQIPDFVMVYLDNHLAHRIEISDGLYFCIFHALSFDLNLCFVMF